MSQENVEVVRRWIESYNRRDLDGLIELCTPDFELRSVFAPIASSGGAFRGHAGLREYFRTVDDAYARFELVVHDVLDAGAAALMVGDAEWRGKGSGGGGTTPIFPAFWLNARKVFRGETFTDRAAALDAVGLSE